MNNNTDNFLIDTIIIKGSSIDKVLNLLKEVNKIEISIKKIIIIEQIINQLKVIGLSDEKINLLFIEYNHQKDIDIKSYFCQRIIDMLLDNKNG